MTVFQCPIVQASCLNLILSCTSSLLLSSATSSLTDMHNTHRHTMSAYRKISIHVHITSFWLRVPVDYSGQFLM
uniref:Secreted protein n=1 Tax=Rhizophora mucronata TaxID=61149 RepID=A0A2P2PJA7_RHIMU